MSGKVLPESQKDLSILDEDEDQGEMDTIFFLSTTLYTIYLCSIKTWYNEEDSVNVNNFHLIVSNMWAFFPVMQAQGLWLKILIICSSYFSVVWHWTADLDMPLPADKDFYGKGDVVFSILTIISYCLSWVPKFKTYVPTRQQERKCWYYNCRGRPKETSEWRCRWTLNLMINIVICCTFGIILFVTWEHEIEMIQIILCWVFICVAVLSALYQLFRGELRVGHRFRKNFIFWVVVGTLLGIVAFMHKVRSDINSHSIWHVYVMSCAYSFSRASEYLEIYKY